MATPRVAINGFGRIGRLTFRAFMEAGRDDLEFVAINDLGSADMNALLLEFDTVHGRFPGEIAVDGNNLRINGKDVAVLSEPNPEQLPWAELGVDIVMDCTGRFTKREAAAQHLKAGAKRVLVSAPCSGADLTVVYGVNDSKLTEADLVVSNASCTTNCLAPVAEVLLDQTVAAGIGTIYSAEALFARRLWPWTPADRTDPATLLMTARVLMARSVAARTPTATGDTTPGRGSQVHGRLRQPCRRCGTPVAVGQARRPPMERPIFYCPTCQAEC